MWQPWQWAREKSINQNHLGHNLFNCKHEYIISRWWIFTYQNPVSTAMSGMVFFSRLFFGRFYFFKNIKTLIRLIQLIKINSNILYIKITQMSIFWRVYQFFFLPYLGSDGWLWNSINTSLPLTSMMNNITS